MNGSLAYASQEPWIFSDTLRENILFGSTYLPDWYDDVVNMCALNKVRNFANTSVNGIMFCTRISILFLMVILR